MDNFLNKQLCIFCTPIDSSHFSVHKSIKVRACAIVQKLLIYKLFNIYVNIKYKICQNKI